MPFLGLACYGIDFAKDVNWFIKILMKTSPLRCGAVAIVLACFGFGRTKLECNEIYCHFDDPKVLMQFLDISSNSRFYIELVAIVISILFYRILAFLSIWRRLSI